MGTQDAQAIIESRLLFRATPRPFLNEELSNIRRQNFDSALCNSASKPWNRDQGPALCQKQLIASLFMTHFAPVVSGNGVGVFTLIFPTPGLFQTPGLSEELQLLLAPLPSRLALAYQGFGTDFSVSVLRCYKPALIPVFVKLLTV